MGFFSKISMILTAIVIASLLLLQSVLAESLRISAQELKNHLSDYIILDSRDFSNYEAGHILGALDFPVNFTYRDKKKNGQIVAPLQMQEILRQRGIDINTPLVVYDGGNLVDAARLFWALEVYGIKQVKVLEQGYDYWQQMDYPVSLKIPKVVRSHYVATINHKRLASKFSTLLATKNPNHYVIDARAHKAYIGKVSTAKRYGHIPTAVNYPFAHNLMHQHGMVALKPVDALKQVYQKVPENKRVIIYCSIGRVSASNYFALRELGYDVANYDASWKEWGNDFSLPIEK